MVLALPWNCADTLKRNQAWMAMGDGVRLLIQAAYFILMARYLGPRQYGMFIAVVAAVAIVSPFVGNGFASLMIRNVARDRAQFATSFGNLLAVTFLSSVCFSVVLVPACLAILPRSITPPVIGMIVVSDIVVFPYVSAAGVAFWSLERLNWTAGFNVFATFTRLMGMIAMVLTHRTTLDAWAATYLVTSACSSVVAMGCALALLGLPELDLRRMRNEFLEGFKFSVGLSAQTIYNDIDKTMLARSGILEGAGIYAAAYRIIDVAFVPVSALLSSAYPDFFRHGKAGIRASMQLSYSLLGRIIPYSLCVFVALLVCAPAVPWVLGHSYAEVAVALRWLAILPVLKTFHYFGADSLTGAGYQGRRTLIQVGIAAFNIQLNLWAIPAYGWRGAAWSSIASDGLLAVSLWLCATHLSRRSQAENASRDERGAIAAASGVQYPR